MSMLSKGLKGVERAISNVIPHQHSADRRATMQAAAEELSFYKDQKDQLHKENERLSAERETERQKIAEKQIRNLRHSYRSPGFMDSSVDGSSGLNDTLG